ncbi:hypothetical protein SUGI_0945690 [Cryptomeria japonica]|uniref:GCN5-related N-acetyltransferase 3, chloroplastic n=1 Tax=Cryptomeria japonica TaxID=3369 RepID=UPI0024147841|nr:GCN5-related N-acetyltransferase 3, chloroplastic [Cryptomeria japonica]GLJ44919.1 hypothetical protein SUGI_0945690 [Cryptomeria japonica]
METGVWVNAIPQISPLKNPNLKKHANFPRTQSFLSPQINLQSIKSTPKQTKNRPPRFYINTNPLHINVDELRGLLTDTHQNCDRFPETLDDGSVKPVDPRKLKVALLNSTVVVSVHTGGLNPHEWVENLLYGKRPEEFLVGFGRATSDSSLTASIHDLAVDPALQGLGIGRKILERIIRILTSRGIDDIAAVCSQKQRPFFQACGFADDILSSTTMIYSRNTTNCKEGECIKYFGRKPLLVPAPLEPFSLKR